MLEYENKKQNKRNKNNKQNLPYYRKKNGKGIQIYQYVFEHPVLTK